VTAHQRAPTETRRRRVTVLGAGSWGVVLAALAARAGNETALWVRDGGIAAEMRETRVNARYMPDLQLAPEIDITSDLRAALAGADLVIVAVPTSGVREVARTAAPFVRDAVVVSAAKGLEPHSLLRMTEVLAWELPNVAHCVLSGPNLAREIAAGMAAAATIASEDREAAAFAQATLMTPQFRVYTHDDVVGVEIGGAMKNVVALAAGMADGLAAGDNAKAALMTRGLAEMARLGTALGANPLTIAGLSGLGDLIATCGSPLSRNNRAGRMLAEGLDVPAVRARLGQTAEGIATAPAAVELGRRHGVEMPIAEGVCAVLAGRLSPRDAVALLMEREPRTEIDGR
jgi:glycerol-3-phosphate dehydrogenase (NAD(P)+)